MHYTNDVDLEYLDYKQQKTLQYNNIVSDQVSTEYWVLSAGHL